MQNILNCKILKIPKIEDPRGNLSVIENDVIPFPINGCFYQANYIYSKSCYVHT